MSRKKNQNLTDAEHRIMDILWRQGSSTVAEVADELQGQEGSAYTTVLTILRILRDKGFVTSEKTGRSHTFKAAINKERAAKNAVSQLLRKFFDDSPKQLVQTFLQEEEIDASDLEALRRQILESPDSKKDRNQ